MGKLRDDVKTWMEEEGIDEFNQFTPGGPDDEDEDQGTPPPVLKAPPIKQPPAQEAPKAKKVARKENVDESAAISDDQMQSVVETLITTKVPPIEAQFLWKKGEYTKIHSQIVTKKRELKALRKQHDDMLFNFTGLANPFSDEEWESKNTTFEIV